MFAFWGSSRTKALSRFDYEESIPHKREGFRVKRKLRDKNARQGLQGDEALAGFFLLFRVCYGSSYRK